MLDRGWRGLRELAHLKMGSLPKMISFVLQVLNEPSSQCCPGDASPNETVVLTRRWNHTFK